MQLSKAIIIAPSYEQRVSKMAYSLVQMGIKCEVLAEECQVSKEFENYIQGIPFSPIPCSKRLKRTPIGRERLRFIREKIEQATFSESGVLIIARDVNYGHIVTRITGRSPYQNVVVFTDVADNYDLLYASYGNALKRAILWMGFRYLTRTAFSRSDGLLIVTPINLDRIKTAYPATRGKPILVLRNLPLQYAFTINPDKVPNSMVYIGKIDEISRDPMYILEKLRAMDDYSLHFYSSQKEATLQKIRAYAEQHNMSGRVIFHERVPYDQLGAEISRYMYGLVPHTRSPITDYTVPNKIYDYKSSGIVTVMSDCPSLVMENNAYGFGVVYSKQADNFQEILLSAKQYELDFTVKMPTWEEECKPAIHAMIETWKKKKQQGK